MAYHHFDDVQEAARFIADIGFSIAGTSQGDFTSDHVKYHCNLSMGDSAFGTSFQSNPQYHDEPTVVDVLSSLCLDASSVDGVHIDDFADEMDFKKPSEAIRAYEGCKKALDWLKDGLGLDGEDIAQLGQTLDENEDEVKEAVTAIRDERAAEQERTHPEVPEGFVSIESLQASLDLGDYGDQLTEYEGYITKGDIFKMTQMAQYECFSQDMYEHQEDICKNFVLESLKDAGLYAVSDKVADALDTIDFASANRFEELTGEAVDLINNAMDEDIVAGVFNDLAPSFYTVGEDLVDDYNTIRDANSFNFPNHCAMSAEAIREVNRNGLEAAIHDFWKPVVTEAVEDEPGIYYVVSPQRPCLKDTAQECRASASGLEQAALAHDEPARGADGEEH